MLNLLKSDLYRLAHGKMIWICSAIVACAMLLNIGMSWLITTDAFRTLVEQSASTSQATRGDFAIMVGGSDVKRVFDGDGRDVGNSLQKADILGSEFPFFTRIHQIGRAHV